jgi:hypothetical protein
MPVVVVLIYWRQYRGTDRVIEGNRRGERRDDQAIFQQQNLTTASGFFAPMFAMPWCAACH